MRWYNPFAFVPMAVTLVTCVVYLAILIPLLIVHETVPSAPSNPTLYRGLNLTEAWLDLEELSNGYHPFNSRRNNEIRNWLLSRVEEILDSNGVKFEKGETVNVVQGDISQPADSITKDGQVHSASLGELQRTSADPVETRSAPPAVVIFNDLVSNYTSNALTSIGVAGRKLGSSVYFEGNNIIVYIRGTEDEAEDWWRPLPPYTHRVHGKGGVMVNAHIDSVSTGYGATDDGMGVVTALQLIKYYTAEGNTPKRGVIVLLNNGEEDGLYGAKAFLSHPMATFVHAFLNLEGAGAGGRAMLFRSTDSEVTRAYATAKHPFGTVVSADGFGLGIIRSETDYVVFRGEGYRGLDVAFYEPRARYHTEQDDTKHASRDSLWHMLSASVSTMDYLTSHTKEFIGPRADHATGKVKNGGGSDGVWFDLFGTVMAVFRLRTLFVWSLTLLITSPLVLMLVSYMVARQDKYYLFAGSVKPEGHESEAVSLQGWRGAFRYPFVLIVSAATTIGSAFLLRKFNPLIVYSSQYAVWSMSLSLFFCVFWFLMASCNFARPSALHRTYALIWMFTLGWLVVVGATVFEDRYKVSGGYIFVFYEGVIFIAAFIGLCELFALPRKSSVVEAAHDEHETRDALEAVPHSDALISSGDAQNDDNDDEDPSETTPLVGVYNLVAFPFSANNRFKAYFQQTVDLDSGINKVTLAGIEEFVRDIITEIPSAAGQNISCTSNDTIRQGLSYCSWNGIAPRVVDNVKEGVPPEKGYKDWMSSHVARAKGLNKATFNISAVDTKACIIRFDDPFTAFTVRGAAKNDAKFGNVPESGSDQIKLWHRDWDREWIVDVEWPVSEGKKLGDEGRSGRVVCWWSDHNKLGMIPALDEVQRFMPQWAAVTKLTDGLVEGSKAFIV